MAQWPSGEGTSTVSGSEYRRLWKVCHLSYRVTVVLCPSPSRECRDYFVLALLHPDTIKNAFNYVLKWNVLLKKRS